MADTKPFQIIVAEDNTGDIQLVREALKAQRVDVEMVVISDGAEVIRYFRALDLNPHSRVPDLVLLDMHLPKHDGEEVLNALRSSERIAQTPVVVMTGSTISEFEEVAQKHAALYYFKKPSTWEGFAQLGNVVRDILENEKARREADQAGTNQSAAEGAA